MINLGDKVKCKITGFTGIVTSISSYLYGCRRVQIQSQSLDNGKMTETGWLDELQLDLLEAGVVEVPVEEVPVTGGDRPDPPSREK